MLADGGADDIPIQRAGTVHHHGQAALLLEEIDSVDGKQAAVPLGSLVGLIGTALGGKLRGGQDGEVGNRLHAGVGEGDGLLAGVADLELVKGILESHEPHADGTVAEVGVPGFRSRIVVDVDDVIEHPHGGAHGLLQQGEVKAVLVDVEREPDGTEIADGGLLSGGVEQDLGAEIGAMDDAGVILRGAQVGGILEGDPRVPRLENHREDLAPDGGGLDTLEKSDLAAISHRLVVGIALLEGTAVEVVKI